MPMHSHPKVDQILSELRQEITDRVMPPGMKISESVLSSKWKVSRTPIREALRRLESEGFVTLNRFRGFVVNPISIEDVDQLYIIKITLEGLAGRLATPIISKDPHKLKAIQGLLYEMETASKRNDVSLYSKKNLEFHLSIWQWCGNDWLTRILNNLHSQVNRFIVTALHVPNRMERSVKEHRNVFEAFRAGNPKMAEKALGAHFRSASGDLIRQIMKNRGEGGPHR